MRYTPSPADAARRLAGDLAMRLQTPLLPDDPDERLTTDYLTVGRLSSGESALLEICSDVIEIGIRSLDLDIHLRRSLASTLRRLAEVVDQ